MTMHPQEEIAFLHKLAKEQASTIERLTAALKRIDRIEVFDEDVNAMLRGKIGIMRDIARAALEQETGK